MHYKVVKRYGGQSGWQLKAYDQGKVSAVKKALWPPGLSPDMSLEQARRYVKTLNAADRIPTEEGRRLRAAKRQSERQAIESAFLLPAAVKQYEAANITFLPVGSGTRQKRESVWAAAQRLICDVAIHPSDWSVSQELLYDWFLRSGYRWDFCKRVVSALNRYAKVYCRIMRAFYDPLEMNDQVKIGMIEEAAGQGQVSEPLTPAGLTLATRLASAPCAIWLRIAFGFGLRPEEVDMLVRDLYRDGQRVFWTEENDTVAVFYQPKLARKIRDPKRRYKRVPVRSPEQRRLLQDIRERRFRRPTVKQAKRWLPKGTTLYGCRHGFAVYWDSRGVDVRDVSRWLGHQSVTTTERYYLRLNLLRGSAREAS